MLTPPDWNERSVFKRYRLRQPAQSGADPGGVALGKFLCVSDAHAAGHGEDDIAA
jgi:hypothetical protein